jgi:Uma2 family endonuclease
MNDIATQTKYTPEELLKMPDGDRYELVDGNLVEHPMSFWSSYVGGVLVWRLSNHCYPNQLGWVQPEGTTYQCFPHKPEQVRKADVSFIRLDRMSFVQATKEGHTTIAPDLAVEVVSPTDVAYDLDEKVEDFLKAGVRLVWVVHPVTRTVQIHRLNGSVGQLGEHDELSGEDVLPGFGCRVGDLFLPPVPDKPV